MNLKALAAEYGFAECYVFTTEPFVYYERRLNDGALHSAATTLTIDVKKEAPWANAILALIYTYRPYADHIAVSGYYPSSNASYHTSAVLMRRLKSMGIQVERADVPIRELLTRHGTGTMLKNGLTYLPEFGTRYAVQALLVNLPDPDYTPKREPVEVYCGVCRACERVCPSGAIDDDGFHFQTCARAYMEGRVMEPWVMDSITSILGCELCQKACVYNKEIGTSNEMPDAFRLEELLTGNIKPALEIIGKNMNKQGKLLQHACMVAAKQGRADLIPLIEPWLEDHREGVRVAAEYALEKLRA